LAYEELQAIDLGKNWYCGESICRCCGGFDVVIFGARHLWRVLAAYSRYYSKTRMRLSLD